MAELIKISRPHCEWEFFQDGHSCKRQGNFVISWNPDGLADISRAVCYRHRWRVLDICQEIERQRNRQQARALG